MKFFHSQRRQQRYSRVAARLAFTLVEILVVLAIIGVLAAILFPVFNQARQSARRATCASNLKQIGLAMQLYANDNNRFYPFYGVSDTYCAPWADRLFPYVRATKIFDCPAFPNAPYRNDCRPTEGENRFDGSYDLNIPDASFTTDGTKIETSYSQRPINLVRYVRPSSTILALDGDGYFVSPGYQQPPFANSADLVRYGVNARHNRGANVAFADGRVKWLSLESLTKPSLWRLNGPE